MKKSSCKKQKKYLKSDPNSVLYSEKKIDNRLVKELKISKLIGLVDQSIDDEEKIPTRVYYVEKREIDRLIVYSFDEPFELIHADLRNLDFLEKSATTLNNKYVLLDVDLYSSKVYVNPMRSRKQILRKMEQMYEDIRNKKNMKKNVPSSRQ